MISSRKLSSFAVPLLAVLAAGLSTRASAGLDLYATGSTLSTGTCVPQALPGGQQGVRCTGTFYGIRAQRADANRWVEFGMTESGSLLFWINLNGTLRTCAAPSTQGWKDAFVTAASASAFFEITLNPATGVCTSLFAASGSQFKAASAL
jgi:hypothetical protein